jgi:hypothetical protein
MNDNSNHPITPHGGGFFDQIGARIKLIIRLMKDRRINPLLKLLPIASLLYMLIPDLAPGPIDDAAIIWIGAYLFVELCPPEIVEEHRLELESVIEGQFREVTEEFDEEDSSAE